VHAVVAADEGIVDRQQRLAIAAGEVHCAGVARGRITVGVLGGNGEGARRASRHRGGEATDRERGRRRRVVVDAGLAAGDRAADLVGGGERLAAGGLQGGADRKNVVEGDGKGIGGWPQRLDGATGGVDRAA